MIAGAILYSEKNGNTQAVHNVQMVDGKQVITITAKGTYSPRFTTAKAGVPTVIKMATRGTFDCTAALTIPSLSYEKNLPPSGETLIDVPPQKAGTTLRGVCAMGMYNFSIAFN
jgi:plastocyanin domain-containing protein